MNMKHWLYTPRSGSKIFAPSPLPPFVVTLPNGSHHVYNCANFRFRPDGGAAERLSAGKALQGIQALFPQDSCCYDDCGSVGVFATNQVAEYVAKMLVRVGHILRKPYSAQDACLDLIAAGFIPQIAPSAESIGYGGPRWEEILKGCWKCPENEVLPDSLESGYSQACWPMAPMPAEIDAMMARVQEAQAFANVAELGWWLGRAAMAQDWAHNPPCHEGLVSELKSRSIEFPLSFEAARTIVEIVTEEEGDGWYGVAKVAFATLPA